ncbi:hypothetical protein [Aestuariimicrobium ganziense]|uniref:hypothetical protein n=1 Tax=Aestuariimicrobium ganziense TaxID=2773677 RepID=UPI001942BE5A|nr:hypothetical protein [Aestuariimicrobium ganziense]
MGRGFEPRWGHVSPETLRGVLIILGVGLVVLTIAATLDRRSARRADRALQQVPDLPGADESDAPAAPPPTPEYVSSEQAHRPGADTALTDEQRARVEALRDGSEDVVEVSAQLPDPRLANSGGTLVAFQARVLSCPEGIGSAREVMQTLERAARDKTPVVLLAPTIDVEVVDLLVVNTARGTLEGGAVIVGAGDCLQVAESLGGHAVGRADLQSGYVPHSAYGTASVLVVDQAVARFVPVPGEVQA